MKLSELASRVGGTLAGDDREFSQFVFDHRVVTADAVFAAIRGARVDGHEFVADALRAGAVAALVNRPIEGRHVLVDDVVAALAQLGRSLRQEFSGPVIGVTGSNGKTTAKEMLAAALRPLGTILKSQGNQNSEYTSPLAWMRCTSNTRAAVIEMGMRGRGQIASLAEISQPTMGLITLIGTAHLEMVGSRQGIAETKTELFRALPPDGVAHFWAEDDFASYLRSQAPGQARTFGFSEQADLRVVEYEPLHLTACRVTFALGAQRVQVELPTLGRHQALNAAAALLVADSCGVPLSEAAASLQGVELPPMRMEVRDLGGVQVLLDTYNASPDSMKAALQTLHELPARGRRFAILGEMKELGDATVAGHEEVGAIAATSGLERVVFYGGTASHFRDGALRAGMNDVDMVMAQDLNAVRRFLLDLSPGDIVLIKGSRALGLEQVLEVEA